MRTLFFLSFLGVLTVCGYAPRTVPADDNQPESGYTFLFNGKDLTGWKTKKGDSLEGKTETPDKRFKVVAGNLVIDPKARGTSGFTPPGAWKKTCTSSSSFFPAQAATTT